MSPQAFQRSHSESTPACPNHVAGSADSESSSGTIKTGRVPLIPGLTRGLASKAWEQVVRDWEEADPDRSLYVAMKDWEPQWHKSSNLTQKYGQRKTVALEFISL